MKHQSQQFSLTSQLSPDQIWGFLTDETFWIQSWEAVSTTSSAESQLTLQTHRLLAFSKVVIDIRKDSEAAPLSMDFTIQLKSYRLLFHYDIIQSPLGSTVTLFITYPTSPHSLPPWLRPLVDRVCQRHWHDFSATFHTYQHDHLFAQLQQGELQTPSLDLALPLAISEPTAPNVDSVPPVSHIPDPTLQSPHTFSFSHQVPRLPLPTLGFTLWRVATDWQRLTKATFTAEKLTSSEWLLLYSLIELAKEYPSLTGAQLAVATGMHKMVVSDLSAQLVQKHFLRKIKLPHNKKEYQLQATAAGRSAAFAVFAKLQQAEKHYFEELSPDTTSRLMLLSSGEGGTSNSITSGK